MQWIMYKPMSIRKILPTYGNQTSTNFSNLNNNQSTLWKNTRYIDDELDTRSSNGMPGYSFRRYFEISPLLPFGMMLIISTIIFILIVFRRWPGLVAGIVAGCLTSISIYLLLLALKDQRLVYE